MRRWGTVRLRMTLWNVAVLAAAMASLGGVVRYKVQADLFATVDLTHAERPMAEQAPVILTSRASVRSRVLDPMTVPAAGVTVSYGYPPWAPNGLAGRRLLYVRLPGVIE